MKRVLLLSGGLDSAVLLAEMANAHDSIYALHITYGEYAKAETTVAKRLARLYRSTDSGSGVVDYRSIHAPLNKLSTSPLVKCQNKECNIGDTIKNPETWIVPGRNTVFLSLGLALAESKGCDSVGIAVHRGDGAFPDQSPAYIEAMNRVSKEGTTTRPKVEAPFAHMDRATVIRHGALLKVPFEHTLSCYRPITTEHCGVCAACVARKAAFAEARVLDSTVYHSGF